MEAVIQQIAKFLYGDNSRPVKIAVAAIQEAHKDIPDSDVEEAIRVMERNHLLRINLKGDVVESVANGKSVFEKSCMVEVCLGRAFIVAKYRGAIAHVAVRDRDGNETGGTAFFSAEFKGWLATARHLVTDGNQPLRVENEEGKVLFGGPFEIRLAGDDLDLALVRCELPSGLSPLRIEWKSDAVRELDEVLVAGYPPIAGHRPALTVNQGQISAIAERQSGERSSIIISRVTEPGFSGGPVLSSEGLVVGVVEQENIFTRKDNTVSIFNGATPAHYFSEFQ